MTVIVRDEGFAAEDWEAGFVPLADLPANDAPVLAVDLRPADDPALLAGRIGRLAAIRILFPAFNDGRGFTLARRLREMGFVGRLRAAGHVIADQYTMIRRAGFDEVEIADDLAARQPEAQWRFRADWRRGDYQARLRA